MSGTLQAPIVSEAAIDRIYARSNAERWQLSRAAFADTVHRAVAKHHAGATSIIGSHRSVADHDAEGLHAEDLALACACAEGIAAAWDHFVSTFRPELYRAARAMTDDATGRELADSLYGDLFGLSEKDGIRRSLFRYYHGRAKLSTWLRSVLAQRHVDLVRAQRRMTSLDDPQHQPDGVLPAPPAVNPEDAASMHVAAKAVTVALAALAGDDRVRLAYYYVHGLTLAQTGRLYKESEATASRKLERARKALRAGIETALTSHGLAAADIDDWVAVARQSWDAALSDALGVPAPPANAGSTGAPQGGAAPPFQRKRTS